MTSDLPKKSNTTGVPEDFLSHRVSWRTALELCTTRGDEDDKAYWRHELAAFDRAYSKLAAAADASAAAPAAPNALLNAAKHVKSNLHHQRSFGADTLGAWRNACAQAEGDLEEAIDALSSRREQP